MIAAAGEWFVCLALPCLALLWRAFALAGCAWERRFCLLVCQVRRFCGQCPWLSVRWAAWMSVGTDI